MSVQSFDDRGERAGRVAAANVRARATKIVNAVLKDASRPENLERLLFDAKLSKRAAPMYLHMATQIASDVVRRETEQRKDAGTTLNVTIMGQAPSAEAWLEAVKQARAIDVTARPVIAEVPKP